MRSDLGMFQLHGPDVRLFLDAMVPLLDGSRDKDAVADALARYSRQSVMAFLDLLEQRGLLEPALDPLADERWRGQEAFFQKWADRPAEAARRLRDTRVMIVGLEPWGVVAAAALAASGVGALHLLDNGLVSPDDLLSVGFLNSHHVGHPRAEVLREILAATSPWCGTTVCSLSLAEDGSLGPDDSRWDLIIGALAGDELWLLRRLARFAHRGNVQSLFGHLDGLDAVVGPVVVPGVTACWNCVRLRHLANADRPEEAHALHASLLSGRAEPRQRTYLAPMGSLLGHLLALEAVKIVSRYTRSQLVGRVLVQNLVTLETTLHTAIRMPWCEICGGAAGGENPSTGSRRGGHGTPEIEEPQRRPLGGAGSPAELRSMLSGWVDPRFGIIRHLSVRTPEAIEPELPVTCSAVLARYTEGTYRADGPDLGSGKGLTKVEAMIGAVGEAVERYSASRFRRADLYRSAMNDLSGEFMDPRSLCLYDEAQYARPNFPFVPFDPDQPIEWTTGYWLDTGGQVWVPALPTYFDFPVVSQERFCQVTSNGLAAGADLDDAALRAVLELIERDAFMITWLAQRPGRKVLLDSTLDAGAQEIVRQLRERGVGVEMFLLDAGLSIPVVMCLGVGDGERWPGVTVSLAAHLCPRIAARKAMLEQGHVGSYVCRLMLGGERIVPAAPEAVRTLTDHALYYIPVDRAHIFDFLRNDGGTPDGLAEQGEPPATSLADCIERLRGGSVRVAIADVTSPDVVSSPFRVVRALGSGMQPIDFGSGLRRVACHRLRGMLADGRGLNPHPHPLA